MDINLFDYEFDDKLIARYPVKKRDESRLLAVDVKNFTLEHRKFFEITDYIEPGDIIAVNDTKVKKARIFGERATGGKVEIFISEFPRAADFPLKLKALVKSHKTVREGELISVVSKNTHKSLDKPKICVSKNSGQGNYEISIETFSDFEYIFEKCAEVPLPPYLKREPEKIDESYYQTVYASENGGYSVAAPTAGLHFTEEIIGRLKAKGAAFAPVSLNIGLGTFLPVRTENIEEHAMHGETYSISEETAALVNTVAGGGKNKIILTGTSTVRCLESSFSDYGKAKPGDNMETSLYIMPGYEFKITRNLITNFHQPKSSLYIMICALIGIEKTRIIYEEAIKKEYSFFSYGDAMYLHNIF